MSQYILLFCQLTLLSVWLLAALSKARQPWQFLTALNKSGLPTRFVRPVAFGLVFLEEILAGMLLLASGIWLAVTMVISLGLLALFTGWMVQIYRHNLNISCGCFGISQKNVGIKSILRNLGLGAINGLGLILSLLLLPAPILELNPLTLIIFGILIVSNLSIFLVQVNRSENKIPGGFSWLFPDSTTFPKELLLKRLSQEESGNLLTLALSSPEYISYKQKLVAEFESSLEIQEQYSYGLNYQRRNRTGIVVHWKVRKAIPEYGFIALWFQARSFKPIESVTGRFKGLSREITQIRLERNEKIIAEALFDSVGQILKGQLYKLWRKPIDLTGQTQMDLARKLETSARLLLFG